jgi:hypothetical protein
MRSIEEILNIPDLLSRLQSVVDQGLLPAVLDEIRRQSNVEFNYEEGVGVTVDVGDSLAEDGDEEELSE